MNVDYFMKEAIIEADKAFNLNEVPVGGILVDNKSSKIVARGYNTVNRDNNAIKHCELNLIHETCEKFKLRYLENMTLFVTLEPCTMCASAISEVHIKEIYFGAYDEKNGGIEKLRAVFQRENIFVPNIYGGIMEKECSNLLKNFFKSKNG
jgi:Cytosine/adenosine deaminases|tara:strand:+ start:682 stop:1134 length:453 start_codon:yes stop_codon:yes gene_type:complete